MPLQVEAITAQHIGDRKEQQDRVAILGNPRVPGTALVVLADGAGGHRGGAQAAEQVIGTSKGLFERWSPKDESPPQLLGEVVQEAHAIIRLNRVLTEEEPHSTMVAMLLQRDRVDWIHVGDSRLYHYQGPLLRARTRDHSFVESQIAQGLWPADQRERHPNRNLLLQALGHSETPQPTLGGFDGLQAGDTFLLCSDGLWDYFSEEELGKVLSALEPRSAAEMLMGSVRKRANGRGDNVSIAIVKLC